ncbi:bifunctional anthranilate synthase component II/anthranilate phosphoribosyltransferase [Acidiphilium sp. AL]|uniref:Anthranilate phosphoribosyltransferase n=1 Tax=Acidiphilium iwatense TaxID=768198 RepID=A0ABS9DVV0_9PROT|nr:MULTISPECIES: bifunctional anthranilate synthase component II/anthranilate phosphoribosyltransferase [Acidiphilium]MCF3945806.1 bifunctional anthranilate synthase component II/anthranilate phosphoribosyltransferase [Acidiphilium iwatense]MCU4159349.1 bifunctional anthranilate synthase component II/anthranilate phosphoribosyltransferase [Acidiphilium sp. AL]
MILLIDNYDSFTFNLVHFFGDLDADCVVRRNDTLTPAEALAMKPEAIVLSPGPCTPNEAGICLDLIRDAAGKVPILGVCLGHQAIGQAFGGIVGRAPMPMHGKLSPIRHKGSDVFAGLPDPFEATRYHSLIVDRESLPETLIPTAFTDDGLVMGLRHRDLPIYGVQFHPESIATAHGHTLLRNFLGLVRGHNEGPADILADLKPVLDRLARGETLSVEMAEAAFGAIIDGRSNDAQIAGMLMAMRVRRETVAELTGAVRAMRARMRTIAAPPDAIDVCGTGGDGVGTLNISTAVTFVLAGLGVPVAKHGNRALSSRAGAADVLTALGVRVEPEFERLPEILREAGCVFLHAPRHHAGLRDAAAARIALGTRTVFNLLGPMANPARVRRQLIGVFDPVWARPMAETLAQLGTERAMIVHGGGLDELTLAGKSSIVSLDRGNITEFTVTPEDAGLARAPLSAIIGGDASHNAAALRALLDGASGAYRDAVLLNAAAALIVAGRTEDFRAGAALAAKSIDSGAARGALDRLKRASAETTPAMAC